MPNVKDPKRKTLKVDAESYIPPVGDWEETNIIWDFGDGWLICEDRTEYDRRLMAKLTLTCVANLIPQCDPGEPEEVMLARLRRTSYSYMSDAQWKKESGYLKQSGGTKKHYKLLHVRDPEGRPMTCILMVKKSSVDDPVKNNIQYGRQSDLGQTATIELDGEPYILGECRLGTGKAAPMHVEERIIQWFTAVTGKWNEEAYLQQAITRPHYAAITSHDKDLNKYRREVPVAASV